MATDWSWLKNRLVSAKTKTNSFWLPSLSSSVMDIGELLKCASNISDHSITGIINFINTNDYIEIDLKRLAEIPIVESNRRFGINNDLIKVIQNDFNRLFKVFKKQTREFGDGSSLFIGLPLIEGINQFGDYYRAPLLYVQVEMEIINRFQIIRLHINRHEFILNPTILGIEVNKRNMLFKNVYDTSKLDINDAIEIFKTLNIDFKMPLTNEIVPFVKKNRYELEQNNLKDKNNNYLINNVLLGLFEVKGDKLFQDFTTILNNDPNAIDNVLSNKKDLIFDHKKFQNEFNLSQIFLFSNIDIYQQYAVKHALTGDVVIEGPPGTGKSETILNILVNIVLNGKKALFVSEKVTAMDIVYNRLGNLKHIALYVPNVTDNKKKFYEQFSEYESFFEKNYNPNLLNIHNPSFDTNLIYENFEFINELNQQYTKTISSGKHNYSFEDILINFESLDVSNINVKEINQFDEWLQIVNNEKWLMKYKEFLNLKNEIKKDWKNLDIFYEFKKIYDRKKISEHRIQYMIHIFLTEKIIQSVKFVKPFFKPTVEEKEMAKKLKQQIIMYKKLSEYSNDEFASSIIWVLLNNVQKLHQQYFYSWFMQIHSGSYVKKINSLQTKINNFSYLFENQVNRYIENCKHNLRALIIKNFYNAYQKNKLLLLEMCRQGRNGNFKDISWWFNMYRDILYELYPIHIMSFETASVLLKIQKDLYDYVIIDEASQVFLERALPALYRASKYIVAGDTKQLHPSTFFQARANYEDDVFDDIDSGNAVETDEAINAVSLIHFLKDRARLNTMLRYHYRSDFNNLIAFTNNHIYDNELIFMDKATKSNRTFIVHNVENGIWQNNRNLPEATSVVERIKEMSLTKDYKKTVGIITFNKNQADIIEGMLDKLNDPLINEWRDRYNSDGEYIGLFVKNVENVQGDERDIIIFSLGYDKSVTSYGPISKKDGENRLNVAITRSKQRIELFKTNIASEYTGWSSRSPGSRLLVEYLAYCEQQDNFEKEKNKNISINSIVNVTRTENQNKIFTSIKESLHNVFGNFYDIKDNVIEGRYFFDFVIYQNDVPLLAININVPTYNSIANFQQDFIYKNVFMKRRGWNQFTIWTYDWVITPKNVLTNIYKKLLNIKEHYAM